MKHTQLLFVFILIYSVQFKVKVKTSHKQTTEALDIVLTNFKMKIKDHLHILLISNFTSYYTKVLLTYTILILINLFVKQQDDNAS